MSVTREVHRRLCGCLWGYVGDAGFAKGFTVECFFHYTYRRIACLLHKIY